MRHYRLVARFIAALVVVTLTGPSVVTLACNWLCAAEQQAAVTDTAPACHDESPAPTSPKLSAVIVCHDALQGPALLSRLEIQPALSAVRRLMPVRCHVSWPVAASRPEMAK